VARRRCVSRGADIVDAELPPVFAGIEHSFKIIATVEGARSMAFELREHLSTMTPQR